MASWSESNKAKLQDPANAESYKALVEFVVAQSGRTNLTAGTGHATGVQAPIDEKLAKLGREVFVTGKLANGSLDSCIDCHAMLPVGETELLGSTGTGAPTLTGYAGKEWLTGFLKNPGHVDYYGSEYNIMPAFEATMTEQELALLVDWMVGDYYRSPTHEKHSHGE